MANHNNVPGAGWQSWVFDVSIRVTVATLNRSECALD